MERRRPINQASSVIARTAISDVWRWLAGPPLKGKRGPAFWRDGNGRNVALNDDKNVWYDFAAAEGGGVLALVERVLRCSRREALQWLASKVGMPLDQPMSSDWERSLWCERNRAAMVAAEPIVQWRNRVSRSLRKLRNAYCRAERAVSQWAARNLANPELANDPLWEQVWEFSIYDQKGGQIADLLEWLEEATPKELIDMYRAAGQDREEL